MAATAEACFSPSLPPKVAGAQGLQPSSVAFPGPKLGVGSKVEQLGPAPIWHGAATKDLSNILPCGPLKIYLKGRVRQQETRNLPSTCSLPERP